MAAASRPDWKCILQANRPELLKRIDTDSGLFGELLRYPNTFHGRLVKRVWGGKDVVKRIDILLDHVKSGNEKRFQDFCQALKDTGQQDVVDDYLLQIFVPKGDETDAVEGSSNEVPLSSRSRRKITEHWNDIVDDMDSSTSSLVLHELEMCKVLTEIQTMSLKNIGHDYERNEKILQCIEKGSEKKFQDFCAVLTKCNQGQIVAKMNEPSVEVTPQLQPSPAAVSLVVSLPSSTSSSFVKIHVPLPTTPTCSMPCSQESSVHHPVQEVTLPEDGRLPVEESQEMHHPAAMSQETHHPAAIGSSISDSSQPCFTEDQSHLARPLNMKVPSEDVVSRMRSEIAKQEAYDVGYHPENPSRQRGLVLIIANTNFVVASMHERSGTDVDLENLKKLFTYLKFQIRIKLNLTAQEMKNVCIEERQSHKQASVFVLCVLSHGDNGVVFGTDGGEMSLEDMMSIFDGKNCQHLIDKPKLFFVQACQGDKKTEGVSRGDVTDSDPERSTSSHLLPTVFDIRKHEKADTALVLASPPGYSAWRNMDDGSYFVTSLTKVFLEYAHEQHFADMMTKVIRQMNQLEMGGRHKQVSQLQSTLDKHVYLLPY